MDATTLSFHLTPRAARRMSRDLTTLDRDVWGTPLWTERPILIQRRDASALLVATTDCPDRVACWLLQFGPDVTVAGPDPFRRSLAAHGQRLWLQYASPLDVP